MKGSIKEEFQKIRAMGFHEAREYIWMYYKLHFFFIAIIGFGAGSLINTWFINTAPQNYLYIVWLAEPTPEHYLRGLSDSLEFLVENPNRQIVDVVSYVASPIAAENQALQVRFSAMMQLREIDLFITTRQGLYDVYAEGFIKHWNGEKGMSLAGSTHFENLGFDTSDLYVSVVTNTQRDDRIARALEVVLP